MAVIFLTLLVLFQLVAYVTSFSNLISTRYRNTYASHGHLHLSAVSEILEQPDDAQLDQILQVAIDAANKAGILIRDNIGARVKYSKTNYKDVVTEVDVASQRSIEATIMGTFPTHGFLGEESVEAGHCASIDALEFSLKNDGKEWLWCVDPIDGTTNFASGLPLCVVSIGVAYKEQVVVGLVYNPVLDDMYTAIRGRGAFCNGKRINVTEGEISEAVINCGYPVGNPIATQTSMRGFGALSSKVRGLRVIACAAQVMAWVAHGKLSGYYSYDLNAWDVAAGALLIEEAGGRVSDMNGEPFTLRTRDMLCSQGGNVHNEVLETLESVNALSYEEPSCELPDFLNLRRTKLDPFAPAKTKWYDARGQN